MQDFISADGKPFRLVAAVVQHDEQPAVPRRAPEFNQHGDEILLGLGFDMDTIINLKISGAVAMTACSTDNYPQTTVHRHVSQIGPTEREPL